MIMKPILVPIDFSQYSENAFLSALRIAQKLNMEITLINVVNTLLDWDKLSSKEKEKHTDVIDNEIEAKDKLDAFVKKHKVGDVRVSTVVEVGVPYDQILLLASKLEVALIVIGAYGRGGEEGKFIGSNIQKVIRKASCPVLAVKHSLDGNSWRNMALTTALNEDEHTYLEQVLPLINKLTHSIHLLHINTPENFMSSSKSEVLMNSFAGKLPGLKVHQHVYNHLEVENGILEFCNTKNIGWITIVSDHKGGNNSYQIGVTDTVLFKTELPVLSIHKK